MRCPSGAHIVFSAHGVSPAVVQAAADRGLQAIDATCPLVTKVHREAVRFARDDKQILLIGHHGHEEVEGTMGEAPERTTLVGSPDEADTVEVRDPDNLVWLSQTTLSVDETMETVRRLRVRFPNLADPPSDDICYATQNRQVAMKKVAPRLGRRARRRQRELLQLGAPRRGRARARRRARRTASTTRASSTPPGSTARRHGRRHERRERAGAARVRTCSQRLAAHGFGTVEEVRTAEEDLVFSLPRELRRDRLRRPRPPGARGPGLTGPPVTEPRPRGRRPGTRRHRRAAALGRARRPRRSRMARDLPGAARTPCSRRRGLGRLHERRRSRTTIGWIVVIAVNVVGLALAIGFAVPRLRAHRTAFWVPLAAGPLRRADDRAHARA